MMEINWRKESFVSRRVFTACNCWIVHASNPHSHTKVAMGPGVSYRTLIHHNQPYTTPTQPLQSPTHRWRVRSISLNGGYDVKDVVILKAEWGEIFVKRIRPRNDDRVGVENSSFFRILSWLWECFVRWYSESLFYEFGGVNFMFRELFLRMDI